ncbi:MAG TPA: hypothetical protein VGQ02_07515 [Candidatus Limnocylindrales bacterium]|nr:hypothetical protein [Candidatus Limnocylindrales bacterium]
MLKISAVPIDGRPQTVQIKGTVPEGAVFAHVGIRVNIEDIPEPGPANITIYRASYTQGGGRNRVPNPRLAVNSNYWGLHEDGITVRRSDLGPGWMIRIVDKPSMKTVINTGGFRVTPGASYRATMLLKASESSIGHAYFTVTWISDVIELQRERLFLEPAPLRAPDRQSTSAGTFSARFNDLRPGRYRIVILYAGDHGNLATRSTQIVRIR